MGGRAWRVAGIGWLATWAAAAGAAEYTGPDVALLSAQTINAMSMHQQLVSGQLLIDRMPKYFELTSRATPGSFVLNDGQRVSGGLTRLGLGFGGGFGQPSEVGAYAAFHGDWAAITQFPNMFALNPNLDAGTAQVAGSVGLAARGFLLSGGLLGDSGFQGVDGRGQFAAPGTEHPAFRQGAPKDVIAAAENPYTKPRMEPFFSLASSEGVTVGASLGEVVGAEADTFLSALKTAVAPARLMDRLDVREAGVPRLGLDLLDARTDYWGDSKAEAEEAAPPGGIPQYQLPDPDDDVVQWTTGWDDLAGIGLNIRTITQIRPTPLFRLGEATWARKFEVRDKLVAGGARAVVYRRGQTYKPSADAFVAIGGYPKDEVEGWVNLSYSYNSPESTTFFPIPDAHVIGVQFVGGSLAFARPLVPIFPTMDEVE